MVFYEGLHCISKTLDMKNLDFGQKSSRFWAEELKILGRRALDFGQKSSRFWAEEL